MMHAAEQEESRIVAAMIEAGGKVNDTSKYGATPLIWAASKGRVDNLVLLLAHGAEVNARDEMGLSALSEAISVRSLDSVKILLENGADAELKDTDGVSARKLGQRSRDMQIKALFTQ